MVIALPFTLLLAGCDGGPAPDVVTPAATPAPMADVALLNRLSLDLRGRRPSEDEITQVEADPAALDTLAATFLEDPGFGEQLVSWYADIFRTRADRFVVGVDGDGALADDVNRAIFINSVGEEPLRLLQRIAEEDRPYTDYVTVDWTMTNDWLVGSWPVEAVEEGTGWRKGRYTDTRPAAGVLATNGLWWRYTTTVQNANRGRAEAIARYLLCDERFDQPVEFVRSTDMLDQDDLVERIRTDQTCIGCHVLLEPLAGYLYGFYRSHPESFSEAAWYYPARESEWESLTGVAPAYYGEPGDTLYDLGRQIADDPRYVACAVEHGYSALFGRRPEVADTNATVRHREAFVQGGLTLRALYGSLASDPYYRSVDESVAGTVPLKRLSPDQLASAIAALTGYTWTYDGLNLFTNDEYGVRVLAGGADGLIVTQPATDHGTTILLVQERLAEGAAGYAVETEAAQAAADRTLFREVDLDAVPDDAALLAQVEKLVLRAHGRRPAADDADVAALAAMWQDVYASAGDTRYAWKVVLSAVLRHPDFVLY